MPAADVSRTSLLSYFARFYEEVARIKLAAEKDELTRLLQPEAPHEQIDAHELAERVSKRLLDMLDRQTRKLTIATGAEEEAFRRTRYVMAVLADEVFILNLSWPAAEHWPEHLLEYSLFRTRIAGRRFFDDVQGLIDTRDRSSLDSDFAAVLLLALQLGFQGMYRGNPGALRDYRNKLYPLASGRKLGAAREPMFPQAYEYTVVSDRDNTRVALAPWLRAVVYGAIGYLVVSSVVWLLLTWSLLGAIGGVT